MNYIKPEVITIMTDSEDIITGSLTDKGDGQLPGTNEWPISSNNSTNNIDIK